MRKLIPLLLLLAALRVSSAANTIVQQTVVNPDGSKASGVVQIKATRSCTSGAFSLDTGVITVRFSKGAFAVSLIPNDTCTPLGSAYAVTWETSGSQARSEYWLVPTSATPVTVGSVRSSVPPPSPALTFNPAQLSPVGATAGMCIVFSGTSWGPATCAAASSVLSIFGRTGAVTAQSGDYTTAQVTESGNLYFTNARVRAALSGVSPVSYNSSTGAFSCPTCTTSVFGRTGAVVATAGDYTTSLVSEGSNLYFTNARARTALSVTAPLVYDSATGAFTCPTCGPSESGVATVFGRIGTVVATSGDYTTSLVTESGNLYFTDTRARAALSGASPVVYDAATGIIACPTCGPGENGVSSVFGRIGAVTATSGDYTTSLVTEGTNLYYTNARARSALSVTAPLVYDSATGAFTCPTCPTGTFAASVFGRTGAVVATSGDYTTSLVTEGTNLYFTNARARTALSGVSPISYNSSTGAFSCPTCLTGGVLSIYGRTGVVTAQSGDYTTSLVTEGTNLYYTNARARAALSATTPIAYDSFTGTVSCPTCGGGVLSVFGRSGTVTATSGDYTTAQVSESGNQYYTNARARAALSATTPIVYDSATGGISCPTCGTATGNMSTSTYDPAGSASQVEVTAHKNMANGYAGLDGSLKLSIAQIPSTVTRTIASGTAALPTSAIASGACAAAVSVTATGAATTDVIAFTPNADVSAVTGYAPVTTGGVAIYPYATANTINFKVCNPSTASITPGAVTLNWRVER